MTDVPVAMQPIQQASRVRWTQFESDRAVELWHAGATVTDIADALGKSRRAVLCKAARLGLRRAPASRNRLRKRNLHPVAPPRRPRTPSWSRDLQARLLRYWGEGLSTDEIAARLDCPEALIVDRAAAAGLVSAEIPERHVSADWYARNNSRFCAAMQRAINRGLVAPPDGEQQLRHGVQQG